MLIVDCLFLFKGRRYLNPKLSALFILIGLCYGYGLGFALEFDHRVHYRWRPLKSHCHGVMLKSYFPSLHAASGVGGNADGGQGVADPEPGREGPMEGEGRYCRTPVMRRAPTAEDVNCPHPPCTKASSHEPPGSAAGLVVGVSPSTCDGRCTVQRGAPGRVAD